MPAALRGVRADELLTLTDRNRALLDEWLPWVPAIGSAQDSLQFIRPGFTQEGVRRRAERIGDRWMDLAVDALLAADRR